MTNKIIEEQLKKVIYADLSHYDESTNTYYIPKIDKEKLEVNKSYIIHIKDSLYNNDVLKFNYNNGRVPPYKDYLVDIVSIIGKNIKVNAVRYDSEKDKVLNDMWSGYLTINDIDVVKKYE